MCTLALEQQKQGAAITDESDPDEAEWPVGLVRRVPGGSWQRLAVIGRVWQSAHLRR
jgi:hypothetical protein